MPSGTVPDTAPPLALCLGGLDPSAGAGLFRDILTLTALGIHSMGVPISETIQNGVGCVFIQSPSLSPILCLEALKIHLKGNWGIKIGLNALPMEDLATLCRQVSDQSPRVRIWDPIQAPSAGVPHHSHHQLRRMAELVLAGGGWVVSPNLIEARVLAGLEAGDVHETEPRRLADPLLKLGATAVWLKGGHQRGDKVRDVWITESHVIDLGEEIRLPGERRGTGCTLASAWLAYRLKGMDDVDAAQSASRWLRDRWNQVIQPGGEGRPCFGPEIR